MPIHSTALSQLRALCSKHPTAPKVVFVPHRQIGQSIQTALARRTGSWAGLNCDILLHHARQLAEWEILLSGWEPLPPSGVPFLAAQIGGEVPDDELLGSLPSTHHFARTIARAIETLRENGIEPGAVRRRATTADAAPALRLAAACYEEYHRRLDEEGLFDDADIIRWASRHVRANPESVEGTVYAVCDGVELPGRHRELLQLLAKHGTAFHRIGGDRADKAPVHTAAFCFSTHELPVAETPGPAGAGGNGSRTVRTRRAVGAEAEVRGVLQEILENEIALDEVEIACASSAPYFSLLAGIADRLSEAGGGEESQSRFAVTLSPGQPALQTRTGQALRGFFRWIQEDFDVKVLIRLLRSGLIQVNEHEADDALAAHRIATILAGRRYETGRAGYRNALGIALEDAEQARRRAAERGLDTTRENQELSNIEAVRRLVEELLELAPRRCTIQRMAKGSIRFLERFGPIERVPEKDEQELTPEQSARNVLYQKLEALTRLPIRYESSAGRLSGMFEDALERQFVRSERPRPGAVHVSSLELAGYTGRTHLFVLGMDSNTLSWPALDDVMLRDADRLALAEAIGGDIRENRGAADEAVWRIEQAFLRHQGPLTLSASVYDIEKSEELFPASLFLDFEEASLGKSQHVGLLPGSESRVLLADRDAWLQAYVQQRSLENAPAHTARQSLASQFPWISDGEAAHSACRSEGYTSHDGLLAAAEYPHLDFTRPDYTGPPMSAGRLETFAETPYLYFIKYVLGITPLDEPALDEAAWLDPLRRGTVLHRTYEAFMKQLGEEPASLCHLHHLFEILDEQIAAEKRRVAPPNPRVEAAARRALRTDCRVFLQAEIEQADHFTPRAHEIGFGYGPRHRREGDYDAVSLHLDGSKMVPLRGRIDRVDTDQSGELHVWDYKTGSASPYSEDDPLASGAHMQWALYAYVLEELTGETVARSGYFFATAKEMGVRIAADPTLYREEVIQKINHLGTMARAGAFPMNPRAKDIGRWKWNGYERLFPSLRERGDQLKCKTDAYPDDRPRPLFMD